MPRVLVVFLLLLAIGGCGRRASDTPVAAEPAVEDSGLVGSLTGESLDAFDSTFTDQSGHTVTLASYHGRPMVLAMIYTHCTSACPLLLNSLRRLETALPAAQRADTWFVLVTLDPAHDPPDTLRAFAASRGLDPARWRLLRGSRRVRLMWNQRFQRLISLQVNLRLARNQRLPRSAAASDVERQFGGV